MKNEKMKNTAIFIAGLITGLIASSLLRPGYKFTEKEYIITTVHDTLTITRPVPVAVPETIRIETANLPMANDTDSVAVLVPITSAVYSGDGYRARISGYRASLDSLTIDRVTVTHRPKPKRWAIGLQTGIAATPRGVQPFIGVGLTYKLVEF